MYSKLSSMVKLLNLACVFFIIGCSCGNKPPKDIEEPTKEKEYFFMDKLLGTNPWQPLYYIEAEDTSNVLKVTYSDEMNISKKQVYCKLVVENIKTKEYKLTAPWLGKAVTLQKGNILDFSVQRVPKEEMK